jgi:hypothetical protein
MNTDPQSPKMLKELTKFLLDNDADLGGRDDCALELAKYDNPEAESALFQIASDAKQFEMLIETCGESLATIWRRNRRMPIDVLERLAPPARAIAAAILKPGLIEK